VVAGLKSALDRRFGVQEYLVWSTAITALMFVPIHGSFQLGYAIIIVNTVILLALDRLTIHRNHMLAILILAGFSLVGASSAGTPLNAPISQLVGISLLSVYFFSALTILGPSLIRWMEIYMRAAFAMALIGLVKWAIGHVLHTGDPRLTAIYSEPSYFVYVTLPAVSYCANSFIYERRYGRETIIFLLSYALADSTLGFFGLLLIAALIFAPRLKGWHLLAGALAACSVIAVIYVASGNVRTRADEFVTAVAKEDLSGAGNTTFAFLSNVYITSQSFLAHPFTGVGLGGYANAYDTYIGNVLGTDSLANRTQDLINSNLELNRDDAASMFLRVTAELGLPGLAVLLGFLIICARVRGQAYTTMRNAILPYLIVRMTRMGHYFTVELYFFAGIYLLNYLNYRNERWRDNFKEKMNGEYA
jgi:O-antigen ligase